MTEASASAARAMSTPTVCQHCKNGWFDGRFGEDVECVNGVLIDIDEAHDGWQSDVEYPAAPCVSLKGKWPAGDPGCQARLREWSIFGEPREIIP